MLSLREVTSHQNLMDTNKNYLSTSLHCIIGIKSTLMNDSACWTFYSKLILIGLLHRHHDIKLLFKWSYWSTQWFSCSVSSSPSSIKVWTPSIHDTCQPVGYFHINLTFTEISSPNISSNKTKVQHFLFICYIYLVFASNVLSLSYIPYV